MFLKLLIIVIALKSIYAVSGRFTTLRKVSASAFSSHFLSFIYLFASDEILTSKIKKANKQKLKSKINK